MRTKEHLSKHDREIAEIRAIQKRTEANIEKLVVRTEESIAKAALAHGREMAEIWVLMGKLAKGTEAAQQETREIRDEIRALTAAVRALVQRSPNGHKKR